MTLGASSSTPIGDVEELKSKDLVACVEEGVYSNAMASLHPKLTLLTVTAFDNPENRRSVELLRSGQCSGIIMGIDSAKEVVKHNCDLQTAGLTLGAAGMTLHP